MCGIAGRFHPDHLSPDPLWHERADQRLAHRGPDGSGYYVDERCELVFRRLALIDLTPTGDQPMCNEDGSVYVVFNGEIYNYQALRADLLQRGHVFHGTSDTEVLVHLYEDCGSAMLPLLQGMFAFALYDLRQRRLLLARDRFGIKPLYYAHHDQQWVFGSEIKAITALTGFSPTINRQACYDYLGLAFIPEPLTGFNEIQALPRASMLVIDAEGETLSQYYVPKARPNFGLTLPTVVDQIAEELLRAVKSQTIADVPVATLLSGGIDSSLIVAAYCRAMGQSPNTFNVRFPEARFDETELAQVVSSQYHTDHHTIDLDEQALQPESIIKLLRHFDQPYADTSLIPMYWISKAIRAQGYICTLSGDGGDEVYGGYARFWRANTLTRLARLPHWLQTSMIGAGNGLAHCTRDLGRRAAKAVQLAQAGHEDSAVLLSGLSNYLSEAQKQALVLPIARDGLKAVVRHFEGEGYPGSVDLEALSSHMTENLFSVGLPSRMLRKVDMMSMFASIEVRVPLLDEAVVGLGLGLPHRLKTDGRTGKLVLRSLAERWLPPQIAAHPKHGFDIPLDAMASHYFHQMLEDFLLAPGTRIRAVLSMPLVEEWLKAFKQGSHGRQGGVISREGLYERIMLVLALELWMRDYNLSW